MNSSTPFKRYSALVGAINLVIRSGLQGLTLRQEIEKLASEKQYQSRGHGGGYRAQGSRMKVAAKMRRQRSKYQPHQGKREKARRALPMSLRVGGAA